MNFKFVYELAPNQKSKIAILRCLKIVILKKTEKIKYILQELIRL